jgi:WD40 repeat protein
MVSALIAVGQFSASAQDQGDEGAAAKLLTQLGAETRWQTVGGGKQLEMIDLVGSKVRDEDLPTLGEFKDLSQLFVPDTAITDAGLAHLSAFPKLTMLNLSGTKVTDEGLKSLSSLPKLRWLALHKTSVTEAGLKNLPAAMETLWLSWTKISEEGVKDLARFSTLRTLRLGGVPVTDAGLKNLTPLKELRILWLDRTQITDAGLKELLNFKHLEELRLDGTNVSSDGLKQLGALKMLQRVHFNGANVMGSIANELVLRGHTGPVHGLCFTPDGSRLVSASGWPGNDNSIRIWDLATGKEMHRILAPGQVGALILTADGTHVLAGAIGTIMSINVATGQVNKLYKGAGSSCASLQLSLDGKFFYSASIDGFARRWNLAEGTEVARYRVAGKWARFAGELPGQRVVTVDEGGVVQIWDVATSAEVKRINTGPVWLTTAAILPGGNQLVTGTRNATTWDLETGAKTQSSAGHQGDINTVALSPDNKNLLTASSDGTARLWNLRDGKLENIVFSHDEFLFGAAYSANGKFMAVAGGGVRKGNDYLGGSAHDIHVFEKDRLPIRTVAPPPAPQVAAEAPPTSSSSSWLKIGGVILLMIALTGIFLFGVWRWRGGNSEPEKTPAGLTFTCAQCGKQLRLKPEIAGKKIKCPKCGTIERAPVVS